MAEDAVLRLGDGRALGCAEYGNPAGEPFFYFHGHPASRLEARFAGPAAAAAGVRIVALDRPGCGRSDWQPGRAILDWPADVAQAADLLGIGEFSVVGASGGGPYALACAYKLPDRVRRAGVLSGPAPYNAPGVTRGVRWQNRVGFRLSSRWPVLAGFLMRSMARNMQQRPARTIEAVARALSQVDAEVVRRPEVTEVLVADFAEAFRQGSQGAAWDMVLLGRAWGFPLREIKPTVHMWHGQADTLVSPAMGSYLAEQIPHCEAHLLAGEGHLLVIDHMAEIIEELQRS